jgi:hypothetical protein
VPSDADLTGRIDRAHLGLGFGGGDGGPHRRQLESGWHWSSDCPWMTMRARRGSGRGGEGEGVGEDLGCFRIRWQESAEGAPGDGELQTKKDTMIYYKEKCLEGLRGCARSSRRDRYQKWEVRSPRCVGIVLARR